jgi:hypothetical protein
MEGKGLVGHFNPIDWVASGPISTGDGLNRAGPARYSFLFILGIFQNSNTFKVVKYERVNSRAPKISKLGMVVDKFIWDMFPFWPNLKFSLDFTI